jgi:hypothetical protein
VKPGFVRVGGKEKEFKQGRYQLRSYEGSRMVYAEAGEHAGDALAAREKATHLRLARRIKEYPSKALTCHSRKMMQNGRRRAIPVSQLPNAMPMRPITALSTRLQWTS